MNSCYTFFKIVKRGLCDLNLLGLPTDAFYCVLAKVILLSYFMIYNE